MKPDAPFPPYAQLLQRARQIALVHSTLELLSWDCETQLPPRGLPYRTEQLAHFSTQAHHLFTDPAVGDWIRAGEDHGFAPGSDEAANLREWRRTYDRATRIPAALVDEFERTRTHAREAWKQARGRSHFPSFQPHLAALLELNRRRAEHLGYSGSPYDALLEEFEPGVRVAHLTPLFAELRSAAGPILASALARSASTSPTLLDGDYPIENQKAFNREVAEAIGFDFDAGRVDTTVHPFCSRIAPGDCRLANRYDPRQFTLSLFGMLHEAGHGLYEQGLPEPHFGTPLGTCASLGIHESQSRLWENHVGRSLPFWEHWFPIACRHFPSLTRLSPDLIFRAVNHVAPSFRRVDADPVTYDLHILLRFDLEVRLLEESLAVKDLPAAWNAGFEELLGLRVPSDAEGCLQDIHWSYGELGYFPTYSLGNLNASQLMHRATQDLPGLNAAFRQGDHRTLLCWLRDRIHRHGRRFTALELMQSATGEPTTTRHHLDLLRHRFS